MKTSVEILKELMNSHELSEYDLIKKVSLTTKTLHELLNGIRKMEYHHAQELAKAFGINAKEFKVKENLFHEFIG